MEGEAASTCCCFALLSMLYLFLPPGSCCFQIARNRNLDPYCASSCASLGLRRAISEALRRAAPLPTSSSTSCSQPGDTASHGINLDQRSAAWYSPAVGTHTSCPWRAPPLPLPTICPTNRGYRDTIRKAV
ncbi:hypothetical protein CABS03_14713 [Colletotrichum abscissum]|uniref:Secreted protein n=1 Tax=Colletotrichum abscissum TaxID=1671311 RepID=A0A9P9XNT8_9PEZI|nr:hypothetical protein CABS02_02219 [Colletotrichum abscissum]